jgi:hypothetical protein
LHVEPPPGDDPGMSQLALLVNLLQLAVQDRT